MGIAAAGLALAAGPAAAGTNGQQIRFYDNDGTAYSIFVYGKDQSGHWVGQCFDTPHSTTYINGWWWKETVSFSVYRTAGCPLDNESARGNVWVPPSQAGDYKDVVFSNGRISG
ncbi:hypothetical protein ACZ90_31215 [Streptomyces albus subsp. albus]|nr:hypothetical protein ACZ90_31215 [Streptomyces albus subsp. albus]